MNKNNSAVAGSIISILIVIGFVWYYFGGGLESQVRHDLQQTSQELATDSVKQYEIALRNGNLTDAYAQAALTAGFYLDAKDEANYKKWVATRKNLAGRLGVPDQ